jgi:hypothetical protein
MDSSRIELKRLSVERDIWILILQFWLHKILVVNC